MKSIVSAGVLACSLSFGALAQSQDKLQVDQCAELTGPSAGLAACKAHLGCELVLRQHKSCAAARSFLDALQAEMARRASRDLGARALVEANDVFEALVPAKGRTLEEQPESRDSAALLVKTAERMTGKGTLGTAPALAHVAGESAYFYYGEMAQGRAEGFGIRFQENGVAARGQFKAGRLRGDAGLVGEVVNFIEGGRSILMAALDGHTSGAKSTTGGHILAGLFGPSGDLQKGRYVVPGRYEETGTFGPKAMLLEGSRVFQSGAKEIGTFSPTGRNELVQGTRQAADGTATAVWPQQAQAPAPAPAQAPPPAPAPSTPSAEQRAQACVEDADRCEPTCAAGSLIGMLLSRGKGDGQAANAECAAKCQEGKQSCLASAGQRGAEPKTVAGGGQPVVRGRQICTLKNEWCAYENLSLHPPYKHLNRACSLYNYSRGSGGKLFLSYRDLADYSLRQFASDEYLNRQRYDPEDRESARRDSEQARCILASGYLEFREAQQKYFVPGDVDVIRMPNVVFDGVGQQLRQTIAKGYSTAVFSDGGETRELKQVKELARECASYVSSKSSEMYGYLPIAWWKASLEALEAMVGRPIEGLDRELRALRCHRDAGWPYAAENTMWVRYTKRHMSPVQ